MTLTLQSERPLPDPSGPELPRPATSRPPESRAPGRVLLVDSDRVEWLELGPGGVVRDYRCVPVGADGSTDSGAPDTDVERGPIAAALEAVRGKRGRCVLALGGGFVQQRIVELPGLPKKEVHAVLERRAVRLLGCTREEALFSALPFDGLHARRKTDAGAQLRWLLTAMRRSRVVELTSALRERGVRIERTVSAHLARLCAAGEVCGDRAEGAAIVIDVDPRSVAISLVHGDTIENQNTLQGSLQRVPTMALSLIQEVRSVDAFWRKKSRGSDVTHVVVIGLSPDQGERLGHSLRTALPKVEVVLSPDPGGRAPDTAERGAEGSPPAGAVASLAACLAEGRFSPDLSVPLPLRAGRTTILLGAVGALAAIVGLQAHYRFMDDVFDRRSRTARLVESTRAFEHLEERNAAADRLVADLERERARILAIGTMGVDAGAVLRDAEASMGTDVVLESLSVERSPESVELRITGRAPEHPAAAAAALEDLRLALAAGGYGRVTVEPEQLAGDEPAGTRTRRLPFTLRAELRTP